MSFEGFHYLSYAQMEKLKSIINSGFLDQAVAHVHQQCGYGLLEARGLVKLQCSRMGIIFPAPKDNSYES